MNKKLFSIFFAVLLTIDTVSCKNLASFGDATITTITSDSQSDLKSAISKLNSSGGIIYIDTPKITVSYTSTFNLSGEKSGGIIGKKQSDGTYPVIDFQKARDSGATSSGDNGIWVSGSKNVLDHIITRYNNDSGIQLSDNADSNTLSYCYSYRNIDVNTYGANADGFAPKLGATNNVFKYCFAWDNSDDGWDSYDKEGDYSAKVEYLHSACWNNGNPDVFTGKYDYDNSKSLDKNLWTVQQLISSDSSFESNYKNKKFSISNGKIAGISASSWLSKAQGEMNGNGFKFGSKTTAQSSSVYRKAVYSVAFDHKSKGFDNNNSQDCTGYIANCASFQNNINYQLPYTFEKWASNWSWSPISAHQKKQTQGLHYPESASQATKAFYAIRDQIINLASSNKFDDSINFDSTIKSLKDAA